MTAYATGPWVPYFIGQLHDVYLFIFYRDLIKEISENETVFIEQNSVAESRQKRLKKALFLFARNIL